jgi:hypothetical protein
MGKKSGPPAPDYTAAAEKQGQSSLALTDKQTAQNRPDIVTPFGSQTWSQDASNPDKWTQTTTLSPEEQQAVEAQQRITQGRSQGAETLLGQAVSGFQTPMDWNSMPERAGNVEAGQLNPFSFGSGQVQKSLDGNSGDYRQRAQDATWALQKPMLDQQRGDLESQLANQGLARGSEAWNREMQRQGDMEHRAQLAAIDSGRAEAGQMFGQDVTAANLNNAGVGQEFQQGLSTTNQNNQTLAQQLQMALQAGGFNNTNRQGAIAEGMQQRGQTLNELNALLTGQQVNMPQMPGYTNATKADTVGYSDAAANQYQAALDAQNAKNAAIGNMVKTGASAAMMFSDARLKEDIQYTGASIGGIPVVHYRYRGLPGRRIGVIAQDVLRVKPSAVCLDPSGYLKVNYSEICA